MRSFVSAMISASEKAALIARACRQEDDLFRMLIQEKHGKDKNAATDHDFKTLADVLIQETVRHDLGRDYPGLAANIRGEESSSFTNTLGETLRIRVCEDAQKTAKLLEQVLDGNSIVAKLLAENVHADTSALAEDVASDLGKLPEKSSSLPVEDFGIWIDPIDSTSNYIRGNRLGDEPTSAGDRMMTSKGLNVVTVLIGVFSMKSGQPVIGVINQPFAEYDREKKRWRGQIYWGVNVGAQGYTSSTLTPTTAPSQSVREGRSAVVGFTESQEFVDDALLHNGFDAKKAAGAGYKLLCVAKGWVDMYATSKGSTYKWDSCAGHAILNALGGGCFDMAQIRSAGKQVPLSYDKPRDGCEGIARWANSGGILAFRSLADAEKLATKN